MAKGVRIYTNEWTAEEYAEGVDNGSLELNDDPGELYLISDYADDFGEWVYNIAETGTWVPATDAQTAAHLLSGSSSSFWACECSSGAAEVDVNDWYEEEDYTHPYTGVVTHQSAHLEGEWTDAEAAQIHDLVFPKR
jgi:hypothetical protein